MNFLANFVEYKNWGLNALTISALGTLFFTFWQLYATIDQTKKIWSKKSGQSISLQFFTYNFFYFISFTIYGMYQNSVAMIINGLLFVAYIPLLIKAWGIEKKDWKEKIIALFGTLLIPAIIIFPDKNLIFDISLFGLACFLAEQIRIVMRKKDFGALSIKFMLVYLAVNIFWLAFDIAIKNLSLGVFNSIGIIMYIFSIILYFRYKNPAVKRSVYA
jgi:uncharacterized protein with PQ loop repeat